MREEQEEGETVERRSSYCNVPLQDLPQQSKTGLQLVDGAACLDGGAHDGDVLALGGHVVRM